MSLLASGMPYKRFIKSVLLFLGTLFLLLCIVNGRYVWKNLSVFFLKHTDEVFDDAAAAQTVGTPDTLSIPSLQIAAPIIYVTEKGEQVYQEALARGVVHYPGTALPGAYGNVYLFGHSSDLPWSQGAYKTVFASLPQIEVGDKIFITDHAGTSYAYTVFQTKVVSPKDLEVLSQYDNKERLLSLQTSYPLGTALQRFIVLARLED